MKDVGRVSVKVGVQHAGGRFEDCVRAFLDVVVMEPVDDREGDSEEACRRIVNQRVQCVNLFLFGID